MTNNLWRPFVILLAGTTIAFAAERRLSDAQAISLGERICREEGVLDPEVRALLPSFKWEVDWDKAGDWTISNMPLLRSCSTNRLVIVGPRPHSKKKQCVEAGYDTTDLKCPKAQRLPKSTVGDH